jgi:hypothetical protein
MYHTRQSLPSGKLSVCHTGALSSALDTLKKMGGFHTGTNRLKVMPEIGT